MNDQNSRPSWQTPTPGDPNPYAYGGQPGPYAVPPAQPPAPKRPRWWKVLLTIGAGTVGLIILVGVIGALANPTETAKLPADVTTKAVAPDPKPATSAPAKKVTPALPPAVSTELTDGTWIVGDDVKPGRYYAVVPADAIGCYWARLKDTDGSLNSVIANNIQTSGRAVVTIKRTDFAVEIRCGGAQWKLAGQ